VGLFIATQCTFVSHNSVYSLLKHNSAAYVNGKMRRMNR